MEEISDHLRAPGLGFRVQGLDMSWDLRQAGMVPDFLHPCPNAVSHELRLRLKAAQCHMVASQNKGPQNGTTRKLPYTLPSEGSGALVILHFTKRIPTPNPLQQSAHESQMPCNARVVAMKALFSAGQRRFMLWKGDEFPCSFLSGLGGKGS